MLRRRAPHAGGGGRRLRNLPAAVQLDDHLLDHFDEFDRQILKNLLHLVVPSSRPRIWIELAGESSRDEPSIAPAARRSTARRGEACRSVFSSTEPCGPASAVVVPEKGRQFPLPSRAARAAPRTPFREGTCELLVLRDLELLYLGIEHQSSSRRGLALESLDLAADLLHLQRAALGRIAITEGFDDLG